MNATRAFVVGVCVLLVFYLIYDFLFWLRQQNTLRILASAGLLILIVIMLALIAARKQPL